MKGIIDLNTPIDSETLKAGGINEVACERLFDLLLLDKHFDEPIPTMETQNASSISTEPVDLAKLEVGSTFYMGKYVGFPIEWTVLEKTEDSLFVISSDVIDSRFISETSTFTWENCSLRKWLNEEFYESSFTDLEKERIVVTRVKNSKNKEYESSGGKDTEDRIFLLSIEEVESYFPSISSRKCHMDWMLRSWISQYHFGYSGAFLVDAKGEIQSFGIGSGTHGEEEYITFSSGLRPAMWIRSEEKSN